MNFAKKLTFVVLLIVTGCFTAAAQDKVLTFKLTREAHIGVATLTAGEYRMVIYTDAYPMAVVMPTDSKGRSVISVATAAASSGSCKSNSLKLIPNGSSWSVTSACFADSETAFYFPVSRSRKAQVATQTTDSAALAGAQ